LCSNRRNSFTSLFYRAFNKQKGIIDIVGTARISQTRIGSIRSGEKTANKDHASLNNRGTGEAKAENLSQGGKKVGQLRRQRTPE
jgi:hypothetical protein